MKSSQSFRTGSRFQGNNCRRIKNPIPPVKSSGLCKTVAVCLIATTIMAFTPFLLQSPSVSQPSESEPPSTQMDELKAHQEANDRDMLEKLEAERKAQEEEKVKAQEVEAPQIEPVSLEYYQDLALKYSKIYHADIQWLTRVRACESSNNHLNDENPICKGLFQFLPSTFYANAARIGLKDPDIWSADDQTNVAAYMNSIGQQAQWTCK